MNRHFQTQNQPRYFLYARKSSEAEERQAYSIDDQVRIGQELAVQRSLTIVEVLEESRSAKDPGRPVFDRMIERIKAGEADGIIAWHPDRLARNTVDGGTIIYLLDTGALKYLAFSNFWFENNPQGKQALGYEFTNSKYYTDNLSVNVQRGIRSRLARGVYPGRAKHGYMNDPRTKEIIPSPQTFHLIPVAFERYASMEVSFEALSEEMLGLGLANASGSRLTGHQMQKLLRDCFYYGHFIYDGEEYEGVHQPAISKQLFDRAQAAMRNRGKPKTFKRHMKYFALRGLAVCAECGRTITAETQKGHNYYRCTKRNTECEQPYVREESLAAQLIAALDSIAIPADWAEQMLAEIDRLEAGVKEDRRQAQSVFSGELALVQGKLSRLHDLYISGDLDRAGYLARKTALLDEKAEVIDRQRRAAETAPGMRYEPAREPLRLVLDWNNARAGVDLTKLRQYAQEVGSNWRLESRNLLWDWIAPFSLLAQGASYENWLGTVDSNHD